MVEDREYRMNIVDILKTALSYGASDIHLRCGLPPILRINGKIETLNDVPVTEKSLGYAIDSILPSSIKNNAYSSFNVDFAYEIKDVSRFRVNLCRQLGKTALVFRVIPYEIKSPAELNLPQAMLQFTDYHNGLVLITGATGCGKSTTAASLLEQINLKQKKHIITIEDPIEFIYSMRSSLITQRQIGVDVESFPSGIKYAMRQDPDIIFVGEIRDKETVEAALKAAETGHLVFATLHTNDAIATVNRVINLFESEMRSYIRLQLAEVLRATVAQKLVNRCDVTGRIPACELMVVTPTIQDLIMKDELEKIYELIKYGKYNEMITMNMSLQLFVNNGIITAQEALKNSNNINELKQVLRGAYRGTVQ